MDGKLGNMEWYLSGGAGNTSIEASLGGAFASSPLRFSSIGALYQAADWFTSSYSPASTIVPWVNILDGWNLHETQENPGEEWQNIYLRFGYTASELEMRIEYYRNALFRFVTDPVFFPFSEAGRFLVPFYALDVAGEYTETKASILLEIPSVDPTFLATIGTEVGRVELITPDRRRPVHPQKATTDTDIVPPYKSYACLYYKNVGTEVVNLVLGMNVASMSPNALMRVGAVKNSLEHVSSKYRAPADVVFQDANQYTAHSLAAGEHLAIWFETSKPTATLAAGAYELTSKLYITT
jgi:hypothetical protein